MNKLLTMQFIYRHAVCRCKINNQQLYIAQRLMSSKDSSSTTSSSSSSESSDSDKDNSKKKNYGKKIKVNEKDEGQKKETLDLLNSLLSKMECSKNEKKTIRAVPKKEPKPKPPKEPELEEKLIKAAKGAAAVLGGDQEKTEADLLNKIFSAGKPTSALENQEDSEPAKPVKPSELTLDELFSKMRIDRTPRTQENVYLSKSEKIQDLLQKSKFAKSLKSRRPVWKETQTVNLFGGNELNIFDPVKAPEKSQTLNVWSSLEQKELKIMLQHSPENAFEEMIMWTERGMLWQFPINNEIGLEEEEKVHFSEHIFLEKYLQGWCPTKGPVRHFMDLVCIGLSKNPYMTVEEKKGHIMWYKDYFGSKQDLLKEIGAIEKNITSDKTKKIPT